jgi:hypothetical protein
MGNISKEAKTGGVSLSTQPIILTLRQTPRLKDCERWDRDPRRNPRHQGAFKIMHYMPCDTSTLLSHPTLGPSVWENWVKWEDTTKQEGFSIASLLYTIHNTQYTVDNRQPNPQGAAITNFDRDLPNCMFLNFRNPWPRSYRSSVDIILFCKTMRCNTALAYFVHCKFKPKCLITFLSYYVSLCSK